MTVLVNPARFRLGADTAIGRLLGDEPAGLAIDFRTMQAIVRDSTTPVNSFMGDANSLLTYTAPSTKWIYNAAGTLVSGNTLRVDYDPITHAPLGLLVEEQRINRVLNSETLVTQSVTATAVANTLSFWGTGTVTLSGVATGVLAGTGVDNRVSLTFTPTAGSLTLTVTGTVGKAQLEVGTFASSYIPTTVAAVTRAHDNITLPITSITLPFTEGMLIVQFIARGYGTSRYAGFRNAAANSFVMVRHETINRGYCQVANIVGGVQANMTDNVTRTSGAMRIAGSFKDNDFHVAVNGNLGVPDTAGIVPTDLTHLQVGALTGASGNMNTHLQHLVYLPRSRHSNAELAAMSAVAA